ncbi:MAG: FAD-dependent oxidoreductase [Coriobacteriaceae bacterium]|nr:FAD-dependent oxidoreductase [Coriobacteriaceae bacterium]
MKVVIIGGVAGGATAAARLRRLDENAEIVVIERTGYVSYANCGLPYYIGGAITDRSKLTLQTPESFRKRFNIDVRVRQEATAIDREARTVTITRLEDGTTYTERYDKLILSPGARPAVPDLPGIGSERIHTLRTVEDTFRIADVVDREKPRRAVVVGAGFIGLEMAENLRERGLDVTVVQRGEHVMPIFDADMAALLHNHLREQGVELLLNANVTGFAEGDAGITTALADGRALESDLVILSVGVAPESTLARDAGLELGLRGSIAVDEHMRTSDPNIYAVGDAVQVKHAVTGEDALIALAGPANKQGRIAADNICGRASTFTGSQGSSVLKLFELDAAATGLTLVAAQRAGLNADAVILSPANHATYYPGAETMTLKVVYERESGRILGAQAIGRGGVDKRIDVLAVAIRARMTAADLAELDLAYAPPYSSAKDPVNMAGFIIENIREGLVEHITWDEALAAARADDAVLLDTRTPGEHARGGIEGALHIPVDGLRDRLGELPRDQRLLVFCASGLRSYVACRILSQHGFACANVSGGYGFYEQVSRGTACAHTGIGPCGLPA